MNKQILTELLGVRLDPRTYELVNKVARAQGIGSCDFVRMSVKRELARLSFLSPEEKRALEVETVRKNK